MKYFIVNYIFNFILRFATIPAILRSRVGTRFSVIIKRYRRRGQRRHGRLAASTPLSLPTRQPIQRRLPGVGILRHVRQLDRPRYGHLHGAERDGPRGTGAVIARGRRGDAEGADAARALLAVAAARRAIHLVVRA